MQVTNMEQLSRTVRPDDFVFATFGEGLDGTEVVSVEGTVVEFEPDHISIQMHEHRYQYGTWQMLSLVCPKKNASFAREGNIYSDLERLTLLLGQNYGEPRRR